jgi:gamma-glutamylcyclotransferase (GGCT)/AIG2-like uncharacterized protein YtfP
MVKIFVYGTLKKDGGAYHMLDRFNPTFLGEIRTHSRYHLFDQGYFPGMIEDASNSSMGVLGELYEVPIECLKVTDRYECVSDGLFRRADIELSDGSEAIAYLICSSSRHGRIVESGVWSNGTTKKD